MSAMLAFKERLEKDSRFQWENVKIVNDCLIGIPPREWGDSAPPDRSLFIFELVGGNSPYRLTTYTKGRITECHYYGPDLFDSDASKKESIQRVPTGVQILAWGPDVLEEDYNYKSTSEHPLLKDRLIARERTVSESDYTMMYLKPLYAAEKYIAQLESHERGRFKPELLTQR